MCIRDRDAGITPEQVDYINAHGTGTHHNDLFETKAIKLALGEHAKEVKISSTTVSYTHLSASGGQIFRHHEHCYKMNMPPDGGITK